MALSTSHLLPYNKQPALSRRLALRQTIVNTATGIAWPHPAFSTPPLRRRVRRAKQSSSSSSSFRPCALPCFMLQGLPVSFRNNGKFGLDSRSLRCTFLRKPSPNPRRAFPHRQRLPSPKIQQHRLERHPLEPSFCRLSTTTPSDSHDFTTAFIRLFSWLTSFLTHTRKQYSPNILPHKQTFCLHYVLLILHICYLSAPYNSIHCP